VPLTGSVPAITLNRALSKTPVRRAAKRAANGLLSLAGVARHPESKVRSPTETHEERLAGAPSEATDHGGRGRERPHSPPDNQATLSTKAEKPSRISIGAGQASAVVRDSNVQ